MHLRIYSLGAAWERRGEEGRRWFCIFACLVILLSYQCKQAYDVIGFIICLLALIGRVVPFDIFLIPVHLRRVYSGIDTSP
jgi:hypothetical protein